MDNTWREIFNLFYYNVFRFERFTQYWMAYPIYRAVEMVGLGRFMAKRSGKENWTEYLIGVLNDPKGGISLHITGMQITAHVTVLVLIPWNLICGLVKLNISTHYLYGGLIAGILAVIIVHYVAPSDTGKYLDDFKRFESMSKSKQRKSALSSVLVIFGVWSGFIGSFVFYLRSLIG